MSHPDMSSLKRRMRWLGLSLLSIGLLITILLPENRPVHAAPLGTLKIRPLPAFARKYGMPCSSCHLGWPMLSPFGQAFKDNGYQMMNDRDAPIYQAPAYWPVTFRITPNWHRESTNRVNVDSDPTNPGAGQKEARITTHGFDWSGLDFHTGGTLAKNVSFYVLPSSDNTGAFHFETVFARLDNLLGSSWLNVKLGKFELDNLLSEKRILTLTNESGVYQNYHFQPATEAGGFFQFGIGDNQVGLEWMGHSKDDRTRVSASLLSSNDGSPGLTAGRSYDTFLAASQAFQFRSLGLQRVGGFAYIGQAPTYFQYTQGGAGIPGTGVGNKAFYRFGLIGQFYVHKFDFTPIYFHGQDSAFLGTLTPANQALPAGAHNPSWNGFLLETHYAYNPQILLINRYEAIRMSQQALPVDRTTTLFIPGVSVPSSDFGNLDLLTFGFRYYPFISSRAGFAFHNEFSIMRQRNLSPLTGSDLTSSSLLFGFDFAF
jgi:hypothetical protein